MLINRIHYHVETQGAGDPLVLLHGFSGSGVNWAEHAYFFTQQRYRVVTIDLLGHGRTESPSDPLRYAVESAAADLIAIFDALALPSVNLLGYSMGGRLALYTMLEYPQRINRLILESASPGLKTEAERKARIASDEALARRIETEGIPTFAEYWTNLPLFATQPPDLRERLHAQRLNNNPVGLANSLRGMGTGAQPSLWERLGDVKPYTLLVSGTLDTKFNVINAKMRDRLHHRTQVDIPGAGHTIHAEQPDRFRAEVIRFLEAEQSR